MRSYYATPIGSGFHHVEGNDCLLLELAIKFARLRWLPVPTTANEVFMNHQLMEGTLLPSEINAAPAVPKDSKSIYQVVVGNVKLEVFDAYSSVYAAFSRTDNSDEHSVFDITVQYQEDDWSTLRKLVMAAYCQFCKLCVDPDMDISIWDDESVEFEQFTRDIPSAVPDAVFEEDLVHNEGDEGQASGIHYFILQEGSSDIGTSYCLIELGIHMPSYCDDNFDASVSLFVMPKMDERSKDTMIAERRKLYIGRYLFDLKRLFTEFTSETLSLMGDHLSKASMQSVSESLAERVDEWWYLSTKSALAELCPALLEMEIETDCEYDDTGSYFNYLSRIIFKSIDRQYIFSFDSEGFSADEDLLNEDGEFGGEEFESLQGILGLDFTQNQVFNLVETLGHLMMRRGRYTETVNRVVREVAA